MLAWNTNKEQRYNDFALTTSVEYVLNFLPNIFGYLHDADLVIS